MGLRFFKGPLDRQFPATPLDAVGEAVAVEPPAAGILSRARQDGYGRMEVARCDGCHLGRHFTQPFRRQEGARNG